MSEIQEPEQKHEPETNAGSPKKVTTTAVQQTLLLLVGFAAVLVGLALYTVLLLRMGSWLLDRR